MGVVVGRSSPFCAPRAFSSIGEVEKANSKVKKKKPFSSPLLFAGFSKQLGGQLLAGISGPCAKLILIALDGKEKVSFYCYNRQPQV
jgi:hypothetical protein